MFHFLTPIWHIFIVRQSVLLLFLYLFVCSLYVNYIAPMVHVPDCNIVFFMICYIATFSIMKSQLYPDSTCNVRDLRPSVAIYFVYIGGLNDKGYGHCIPCYNLSVAFHQGENMQYLTNKVFPKSLQKLTKRCKQ